MTEYAIGLIGCVAACRQRYGVNVVLDTLRGAKTAKIRQYRMDEVPQYGQFAKVPAYRMRQVLNYLLMHDYLSVTDDTYAILQLTKKSAQLLDPEQQAEHGPLLMKMAKEQDKAPKESADTKGKKKKLKTAGFRGSHGGGRTPFRGAARPANRDRKGRECAALHCIF